MISTCAFSEVMTHILLEMSGMFFLRWDLLHVQILCPNN